MRPIDIVIKVGGALLRDPHLFALAVDGIDHLPDGAKPVADTLASTDDDEAGPNASLTERSITCLVVPGGGPFADAVRRVDARIGLGDDVSHWAAIRAMDQYAHILAARSSRGAVVEDAGQASVAFARGRVPILAPYRWLRAVDPLPHSWSVTSDSIAAWIALACAAPALVLIKADAGGQAPVTDAYLPRLVDEATAAGRRLAVHICTPRTLRATITACRSVVDHGSRKESAPTGHRPGAEVLPPR